MAMLQAVEELPAWSHSIEAEQSVLGALLLGEEVAYSAVSGLLTDADFVAAEHAATFRAVVALHRLGRGVDVVTVGALLAELDAAAFQAAGGYGYLASLSQNCPAASNVRHYAEIVRARALCRRMDRLGQEISRAARESHGRSHGEYANKVQALAGAFVETAAPRGQLRAAMAGELLSVALPPLEPLLEPWLCEKNLVMVHAKRGVGKTHFALACAFAIAAGSSFLGWRAQRARGVLYLDGEMPAQLMQSRLRELASCNGEVPDLLRIVTPDLQEKPMPDLATPAGQIEVDSLVTKETALIVVDNLSCLIRSGGAENESESWGAVSEWALKHRRAGRAVMFIHHSGKTGAQRGTSKREDLLDAVINLRRPSEYQDADGAVFEVHFEKARSLTGDEIAPIEARLQLLPTGGQAWSYGSAASKTQDRIKALWEGGSLTLMDVVREAGCAKSHAHKTLAAAMAAGELGRDYPQRPRKAAQ